MQHLRVLLSGVDTVLDFLKKKYFNMTVVDVHCSLHVHPAVVVFYVAAFPFLYKNSLLKAEKSR